MSAVGMPAGAAAMAATINATKAAASVVARPMSRVVTMALEEAQVDGSFEGLCACRYAELVVDAA